MSFEVASRPPGLDEAGQGAIAGGADALCRLRHQLSELQRRELQWSDRAHEDAATLARLRLELHDEQARVRVMRQQLDESATAIQRLQANQADVLAMRHQLDALGGRLTVLRTALDESERRVSAQARVAARAQAQMDDLPNRISQALAAERQAREAVQEQVARHEERYQQMLASTSWRLSSPIRWAGLQVRRARRMMRLVPVAADRNGGWMGASREVYAAWQDSGLMGLRRMALQLEADPQLVGSAEVVAEPVHPPVADPHDYAEWVRRYDTLDEDRRNRLRQRAQVLPRQPLISVVMPTYNANGEWLDAAIESVRAQIYPHWQLCIADDASTDAQACERLRAWAELDPRIQVVFRETNGHISQASNSALQLARGDWVALMDHDDLLAEDALFRVAEALSLNPELRLLYSDEDKLDAQGQRVHPYFKPDWNIDLFYSQNYFSHLGVYHAALIREVGGFRPGFEGSQDYDLALRCIERVRPDQIHHIARVLYHWRVHADSTASSQEAKPYAQLAGEKALNEHLARAAILGQAECDGPFYRVRYAVPDPQPLVSLIIPTRDALGLVRQCINSILARTKYQNYEIILVDNGSTDPEALAYFHSLAELPGFKVIRDEREFNYSALNNLAVELASGELVGLINNDVEVISEEWLGEMVSIALQSGVGAVGARLWYPDYTLQHGGVLLGVGGVANHAHRARAQGDPGYFGRAQLIQGFSAVTAACLLIRKAHYLAVGGLNEVDLKVAFNDVDFCLRLRQAGLRNVWTPYAELFHHESATRGQDQSPEKRARFVSEVDYMVRTWGHLLSQDPAYNPNLTLDIHAQDFSLAWPPRGE